MTRKNQFWKGMLIGAVAGGVISLLDKQTREVMGEHVKTTACKVGYIVKNPGEVTEKIKGTAAKLKATYEQVSDDISYITEKVDELKELTPQVTGILKETRDTFITEEDLDLLGEDAREAAHSIR